MNPSEACTRRTKSPARLEWERDKAEVARITNQRIRIWLEAVIAAYLRSGALRKDHTLQEYRQVVRDLLASRPCFYTEAEFESEMRHWRVA